MKYYRFLLFLFSAMLFAQAPYQIIYEKPYSVFPFQPRIENCGIFCIDGYSVCDSGVYILHHDSKQTYFYHNGSNVYSNVLLKALAVNTSSSDASFYIKQKNHPLIINRPIKAEIPNQCNF